MHSYNRTMLASLGFADSDKKDGRHDLAVRYLCQKECAEKIVRLRACGIESRYRKAIEKQKGRWESEGDQEGVRMLDELKTPSNLIVMTGVTPEFHLTRGVGQYQTTVGFLDLLIGYEVPSFSYRPAAYGNRREGDVRYSTCPERVLVEVKMNRIPASDILRQINLYGSFNSRCGLEAIWNWECLVTAYAISPDETELFRRNGISHCQLGASFEKYCQGELNAVQAAMEI